MKGARSALAMSAVEPTARRGFAGAGLPVERAQPSLQPQHGRAAAPPGRSRGECAARSSRAGPAPPIRAGLARSEGMAEERLRVLLRLQLRASRGRPGKAGPRLAVAEPWRWRRSGEGRPRPPAPLRRLQGREGEGPGELEAQSAQTALA